MRELTERGRRAVADVAGRHGVSVEAASEVLRALDAGRGTQAQFSHPDLGGMGQWSRGGMTMIGDMFNNALKAKVDALCAELSDELRRDGSFAAAAGASPGAGGDGDDAGLFVAGSRGAGNWWPADLGAPASSGAQNEMRYAVFPGARRLAVDAGGTVTVYDLGDNQVSGVSQRQGADRALTFTGSGGTVRLADLEVVEAATVTGASPTAAKVREAAPEATGGDGEVRSGADASTTDADVIGTIERLAGLREKGILSDAEFQSKKEELLARL